MANIIQERRLLEEVDHPYIVNLRYAFQDDENCFFVLDLMLGGDLRFHLDRLGRLQENVVRFWVAELASALDYLRKQRIIHRYAAFPWDTWRQGSTKHPSLLHFTALRDLKPDNILLDSAGHAHITDFNVALHYSERRLHSSVAGSLAYMAPEVVGRKGYTWNVDWWSLGVVAWELLFHKRPFEGRTSEKMTNSILNDPLRFPTNVDELCSKDGQDALSKLLDRSPKQRLGCRSRTQGMEEVRNHPWFSTIDWEGIATKECQPPFVPDMHKANFDVSHELDEFLMVEKPLTHSKRKANPDFEKMRPELRQLEEQFTVYDFSKPTRVSYYPLNEPIVTSNHQEDGEPAQVIQSATNTLMNGMIDRSQARSPSPQLIDRSMACSPSLRVIASPPVGEGRVSVS
ncbi:hypothetical protein NLI96_g6050 [Meripilus lineatus]|uniref:Kinase-like protein n=1 Tax=Meripilus lineatus TaxID=2056292 RepID=A0AAD5YIH1_9APHY|nr:hypothetical protein NLI96_g6050 [Physisporinus lineatus]